MFRFISTSDLLSFLVTQFNFLFYTKSQNFFKAGTKKSGEDSKAQNEEGKEKVVVAEANHAVGSC